MCYATTQNQCKIQQKKRSKSAKEKKDLNKNGQRKYEELCCF